MVTSDQHRWLILIVEDEPLIGMMIEDTLQRLGYDTVGPAGSVPAAFNLLDRHPQIDGAVLDCNLGGTAVWPVADRLVAQGVPFVFSTGYGERGIPSRFAEAPVLSKPYPDKALERALSSLLSARL